MLNPDIKRLKIRVPIPQLYTDPGKLAKATEFFNRMPEYIDQGYDKACNRFAKLVLSKVRKAIATGIPPHPSVSWKPLSPRTVKTYTKWGYDGASLWYLMGQMYREVNIFKNNRSEYYVGFKRGVKAKSPNKKPSEDRPTLAKLANMLERGGDLHPPRPLFNPAYMAAGGEDKLSSYVVHDLRDIFNRKRVY